MLSALYYPHTNVTNAAILKNALLLWDRVETIVPDSHWQPQRFKDKAFNEAVDLVVSNRKPTQEEKQAAHRTVTALLESGDLIRLVKSAPRQLRREPYPIYPEKFMRETWISLLQAGMARWGRSDGDYHVPPVVGFLMMSLLADACAGTQMQKITDRADAYSWLMETYAQSVGSACVKGLDVSQVAPGFDRLVTLSLEVLDVREVPIRTLVEMRKREARDGGHHLKTLRRRYLESLQKVIKQVCEEARSSSDVKEIETEFKAGFAADLAMLKSELRLASVKALFSREVALSTVLTAGCLVAPIAGLTELATKIGWVGVVPLIKAGAEIRGARRETQLKHSSSWLYLTTRRGRLHVF